MGIEKDLFNAARSGNVAAVRAALDGGANRDCKNEEQRHVRR
jgi:hypothetical protein